MSGEGVLPASPAPDEATVSLEAHFSRILADDPVCCGRVSHAAVRMLAAYAAAPREDADVLAERTACVMVMTEAHARLDAIETVFLTGVPIASGDSVALELRRLGEAIEGVRQGLHRISSGNGGEA